MSDNIDEASFVEEPSGRQLNESADGGRLYAEYRRLVSEQAALRRLATLVARGVEPLEVFGAVADGDAPMRACGHRRIVALRIGWRDHLRGRRCRP